MNQPTLRDIKRAATSAALATAALRLAEEHGLDGFTIDDVATEAGYSRRTFANHFSCKEEAVVAAVFVGMSDLDLLIARLPERISIEELVTALEKLPALPEAPQPTSAPGEVQADATKPASGTEKPASTKAAPPCQGTTSLNRANFLDALERVTHSPTFAATALAALRLEPLAAANPNLLPYLLASKNAIGERFVEIFERLEKIDTDRSYVTMLLGAFAGGLSAFGDRGGGPRAECAVGATTLSLEPLGTERLATGLLPTGDLEAAYHVHIKTLFGYLRSGFAS